MVTMNERSDAGRRLAALKPRYPTTCQVCGLAFEGTTKAVYCSVQCRVKAWRAERKRTGDAPPPRRAATVSREPTTGLAHALAQAERARAADQLEDAARWERIAADIAASIATADGLLDAARPS